MSPNEYAADLTNLFPAVDAKSSTWITYASVYLRWFEYAGLAVSTGVTWDVAPEGSPGVGELLGGRVLRRIKGGWPQHPAGPSVETLRRLARGDAVDARTSSKALRDLRQVGAVGIDQDGSPQARLGVISADGTLNLTRLTQLMRAIPSVATGLDVIAASPAASPFTVGSAMRASLGADWSESTVHAFGKNLRGWARHAGLTVLPVPRSSKIDSPRS